MNTHADKTQENKSQSVANSLPKLQSNSESTFQFSDNRPTSVAQRKLQDEINNSSRVQRQGLSLTTQSNAGNVVQRAGDFTGLMLPHERQPLPGAQSYVLNGKTHDRKGIGMHHLTYHHIIPESKLLRLGNLVMRFEYLYGEENMHTDKLNRLKAELIDIQNEIRLNEKTIRIGAEAAEKIRGLKRRQDPQAGKKAGDRGWNTQVEDGIAAEKKVAAIKNRLKNKEAEIDAFNKTLALSEDEKGVLAGNAAGTPADEALPALKGSGMQTRGNFLRAQIKKLVESTRVQVQAVKDDTEKAMRNFDDKIIRDRADKYHHQDIREIISDDYKSSLGFGGVAWIPGNIHEGPTDRISPGGVGFNADLDDGGDEFELSSRHIISEEQFILLQQLSQNLNLFDDRDDIAFDADRIDRFIDLLQRINEIREAHPGLKQFDVKEWEQVKIIANERDPKGITVDPNDKAAGEGYGYTKAGIRRKVDPVAPPAPTQLPTS